MRDGAKIDGTSARTVRDTAIHDGAVEWVDTLSPRTRSAPAGNRSGPHPVPGPRVACDAQGDRIARQERPVEGGAGARVVGLQAGAAPARAGSRPKAPADDGRVAMSRYIAIPRTPCLATR